jgi:uncharacterized protein YktB (UPF0637 family)
MLAMQEFVDARLVNINDLIRAVLRNLGDKFLPFFLIALGV